MPPAGKSIDWKIVAARDEARLKRVKEIYSQNQLRTGTDYFNAALVLQHGNTPEDYLLAHELCVVAIDKGNARAKWLAAASEDRFLMNIGRPQRFATQFRCDGPPNCEYQLYKVDSGVTDHSATTRSKAWSKKIVCKHSSKSSMRSSKLRLKPGSGGKRVMTGYMSLQLHYTA